MGCQAGVGAANLTTMMTDDKTETSKFYDTIKLGIDAHAKWYYVARQFDGATPQPVQKMTFEALLRFVAKQQRPRRRSPHLLRGRGVRLLPAPQARDAGGDPIGNSPKAETVSAVRPTRQMQIRHTVVFGSSAPRVEMTPIGATTTVIRRHLRRRRRGR